MSKEQATDIAVEQMPLVVLDTGDLAMSTLSIHLPEDLKAKAVQLAKKEKMSLDALVNYWLQTAIVQDETMEWMKRRLAGKNSELLIAEFGKFLKKTKPGQEPTLDEIQQAMKE